MMRRVFSASLLCTLLILALLTTGLTSLAFANNAGSASGPRPRVTQSIDDSQLVSLHRNTHPLANAKNDRGPVSDSFDADHMLLILQRSPSQEHRLNQYIDSLNNRNSPNFHKWLNAEQLGAKYGVSQEDIDKITGWLQYHGFRVNQVFANRMMIDFGGTAGQLREAFHTSIHNLQVNNEKHVGNMNDPLIPAALAPVVKGITSLNDFRPHATYMAKPDYTFSGCTSSASTPSEPGTCYAITPQDDAVIYNLNPLWSAGYTGAGQTIAIIEDTDTYDTTGTGTEWTTYRNAFGLSGYPGTYTESHPGSCADPGSNADDGEAAIDIEMATTFAPGAAINLISCGSGTFTFGGIIAAANAVNGAGPYPNIMSQSYGACETGTGDGGTATFYNVFQTAAAEGTSVFVSTGDSGPTGCAEDITNGTEYDLPSLAVTGWGETPFNVAVGGTDFQDYYNAHLGQNGGAALSSYWNSSNTASYGSAKQYVPEMPWNDACADTLISELATGNFVTYGTGHICNTSPYNTSASYLSTGAASGGASNCATGVAGSNEGDFLLSYPECQGYSKPSWQSAYGVPTDGLRDIPDVSMFAANGVWGHFQTVCWNDPSQTSGGAVACTGAPSTWSGFGGTSVATPSMAGIQALINQVTGENWGNPNSVYYSIAQGEYGTQGGSFVGSACNASVAGGPAASCPFHDVTQGDIDVPCEYDTGGSGEDAHCYKPTGTYGVASTDVPTGATVIWGGSGYTTAPTCTVAGPTNSNPYVSPTGTTLYAGGTTATCTATVSSASTNAVWTVTPNRTYVSYVAGLSIVVGTQTYTLSGTSTTTITANLCTSIGSGNTYATCTAASGVATLTAKTAGAAGNFQVNYAPVAGGPDENETLVLWLSNTTKGQGPNYVSGVTLSGGRGYGPNTPITFGGPGTGAVATANTTLATAASSYQPAYGAAPGYDMATGLGSPNALALVCSSAWGTPPAFCPVAQTITVTTAPPSSAAYGSSFGVAATASSGLAVAITTSGSCSGSGSGSATISMTSGTGTCSVIFNQAGGVNASVTYYPAPTVTDTTSATLATNSVSFTTPAPSSAEYGGTFTVAASGLGTGAITYSSGGVCSNSGAHYTMTASTGTCTVTATQAADTNYASANASESVTAAPANANVSVSLTSGSNPSTYGQSITFTATVTSDTGAVKGRRTTKRPRTLSGSLTWSGNTGCSANSISGNPPQTATCTTSILGGGTDSVTASYSDSNHNTGSGSIMQTVSPAANTVTFTTPAPGSAEYGSSFTVAASGLGTGAITYTSDGVVCTNSGATYTMISGSGNCTVTATQAADANYQTASASESVTAAPAVGSVSVALTSGTNPSLYGQSITFTATVTSDTGAVKGRRTTKRPRDLNGSVTWSGNTGCSVSTVSGNSPETATCTTSSLGIGTDTVTATYTASDSNHTTASNSISQTVNPAGNTVTFTTPPPSSAEYGATFTVAASGQGTGAITYTSDGVVCSNSGATYTMISGSGTCSVTATQAADMIYPSGSATDYVTAQPAVGSVSVALTSGSNPSNYGDSITFTATVTSDTGAVKGRKTTKRPRDLNGNVTWSGNTGCSASSVSGNSPETATCTTSILGAGSDTVTATYTASDSNHTTASGSIMQTVSPAANTVTFTTPAPGSAEYGSSFTVAASGLGTGAITYTSDGVVCTNSGATYTMISGSGTCTVTATQAADANYQTASASESVTAAPAVGSVSVTLTSGTNPSTYGDSITFTATVTSDTGAVKGRKTTKRPRDLNGNVTWSGNTGCSASSVSGNSGQTATCTTSILGGGSDTVTATYTASDSNHTTASGSISQTVSPASQTITVTQAAPASAAYNSSFTVSATASSSLAVAISSTGSCSGSGSGSANILMTSGSGSCLVTFSQAGNANYSAATNVNESTNATPASQSINVSMPAPSTAIADSSFTVVASASSGLPITFAAGPSTVCSITGSTANSATIMMAVHAVHNHVCTITMSQPGNSNYTAAATVTETTTVALATTPTTSFVNDSTSPQMYGATFNVTATSNETGSVSSAVITTGTPDICSIGSPTVSPDGTTVTAPVTMLVGAGSCHMQATWAINTVYKGEHKNLIVVASRVTPTASFTGAPSSESNGGSFTVTATSSETTGTAATPVIAATPATVCTVGAATNMGGGVYTATVTMVKASGTCTTKATWPETTDYNKVNTLTQTTTATP